MNNIILEGIEFNDVENNDTTFDVSYDSDTKQFHAIENIGYNPRIFVYKLTDTEENIIKNNRQEILEYCLATVLSTDTVGLGDIFVHGKYIERI